MFRNIFVEKRFSKNVFRKIFFEKYCSKTTVFEKLIFESFRQLRQLNMVVLLFRCRLSLGWCSSLSCSTRISSRSLTLLFSTLWRSHLGLLLSKLLLLAILLAFLFSSFFRCRLGSIVVRLDGRCGGHLGSNKSINNRCPNLIDFWLYLEGALDGLLVAGRG